MKNDDTADEQAIVPPTYTAYGTVNLCGNKLINVRIWFRFQNHIPIMVGRGERGPRVWVSVPTDDPKNWRSVVVDNEVVMSPVPPFGAVSLIEDFTQREIQIGVGGFPVFKCAQTEKDELTVSLIDLSSLRLGIKGNIDGGLYVGPTHMSKNIFENVQTAIGIG